MKYMLLIYGNEELWASFPPEELAQVIKETDALHAGAAPQPVSSSAPTASPTR